MSAETVLERRLRNEWQLLQQLIARNPGRFYEASMMDADLTLRLHGPAAWCAQPNGHPCPISIHALRISFPVHFPAVPMELFLETPVRHPNIHPETGFVCVWDRHRVSNTVEHALHRLVAMLAGQLQNTSAPHLMQPDAVSLPAAGDARPLLGVEHAYDWLPEDTRPRKRRLQ